MKFAVDLENGIGKVASSRQARDLINYKMNTYASFSSQSTERFYY
jgi:hypothetical protein